MTLPYLTADVPGTAGRLRETPEDFEVEELAAYPPSGAGDHVFVWIEKRGLTTPAAAAALAAAVGVRARDVGWAGMKDRHAVTRQWLSLPPPATPEALIAARVDGLAVLDARRHGHKLRTGHLRGNRFRLRVRGVDDETEAARRAAAALAVLAEPPGALNWFGEQRFGRAGDNAVRGRALLRGEAAGRPGERERRLLISAVQSELFNEWLRRRVADGLVRRVVDGDWLEKRGSGGRFSTTDPAVDEARVAAGEVVVSGPMFGWKLRLAAEGSTAAAREQAVLADAGLAPADFRPAGALAEGTRRALAVAVGDAAVEVAGPGAIDVSFTLPAGAYATAVMREILKADPSPGDDGPGDAEPRDPEPSE